MRFPMYGCGCSYFRLCECAKISAAEITATDLRMCAMLAYYIYSFAQCSKFRRHFATFEMVLDYVRTGTTFCFYVRDVRGSEMCRNFMNETGCVRESACVRMCVCVCVWICVCACAPLSVSLCKCELRLQKPTSKSKSWFGFVVCRRHSTTVNAALARVVCIHAQQANTQTHRHDTQTHARIYITWTTYSSYDVAITQLGTARNVDYALKATRRSLRTPQSPFNNEFSNSTAFVICWSIFNFSLYLGRISSIFQSSVPFDFILIRQPVLSFNGSEAYEFLAAAAESVFGKSGIVSVKGQSAYVRVYLCMNAWARIAGIKP